MGYIDGDPLSNSTITLSNSPRSLVFFKFTYIDCGWISEKIEILEWQLCIIFRGEFIHRTVLIAMLVRE